MEKFDFENFEIVDFSQSFAVKIFNRKSNTKFKIYKFIKFINPLSGMSYNISIYFFR